MKTPQEAAREYMQNILDVSDLSVNYEEDNYDAGVMNTLIEALEPAFLAGDAFGYRRGTEKAYQWISVEDELPEVGKNGISATVLVRAGNYHCASYCKNKYYPQGAWFDPAMDLSIDVTHWRPIEPVKE